MSIPTVLVTVDEFLDARQHLMIALQPDIGLTLDRVEAMRE